MRTLTGIISLCALLASVILANAEMPHHRRCDVAQDSPGNLNPGGGNAVMFGLCNGIRDVPTGKSISRADFWNAYNCGYQAHRQDKALGTNPYYHDELATQWSTGWEAARRACATGRGPFDVETKGKDVLPTAMVGIWCYSKRAGVTTTYLRHDPSRPCKDKERVIRVEADGTYFGAYSACTVRSSRVVGRGPRQTYELSYLCGDEGEKWNETQRLRSVSTSSLEMRLTSPVGSACVVNDPTMTPLNVRARPKYGPILGALNNNQLVVIMEDRGDWVLVVPHEGPGKRGWVWRNYLEKCNE